MTMVIIRNTCTLMTSVSQPFQIMNNLCFTEEYWWYHFRPIIGTKSGCHQMFLSTQFQRIIYGAISCQFYFPLLGHHPKLKLSQKYQGIHHLLFFIKISVSTILQELCYNTLHQYQYGQCKVGDHSWILLGVRGQYSQQHSTHCSCYLTAALHTLTTLLQGVLHCIPSNQCDQWMRTLHCFHQLWR